MVQGISNYFFRDSDIKTLKGMLEKYKTENDCHNQPKTIYCPKSKLKY